MVVDGGDRKLVVAAALREGLAKKLKKDLPVLRQLKGSELGGPALPAPVRRLLEVALGCAGCRRRSSTGAGPVYWHVIAGDFVTLDAGTGIVHVAPAFGEDDFNAHKKNLASRTNPKNVDLPLINAVLPDGTFEPGSTPFAGLFVKDADPVIVKDLRARGLLVLEEKYRHDYPYCWRADNDPLIQLDRPAWYNRTQQNKQRAIENNREINWLPEHIKEGRFGDFLANNVDWALSRERFWGTPLNVWICSKDPEHQHAPSSVAAIEALNPRAFDAFRAAKAADPSLNEHLIVHKPWIDEVTLPCPTCGASMRRATEVIDAWFDSGSMPFAQWGYPHAEGSKARFDQAFPADFISEAIDQTRGWFYSLLMISTLVFDEEAQKRLGLSHVRAYPHPYKTCEVLGHVCDREGKKESKSKGNYTPPEVILERVRMEFAAFRAADGKIAAEKDGVAWIAREDYEGLDLTGESAKVVLYRADRAAEPVTMELKPGKGLPRRVVGLTDADLSRLGLVPREGALAVKPNDVPGLPQAQRVFVEDPATPAPGADAFRWFFYASSPPWTNTRHSLSNVRGTQKEFLVKLRNVYSYFVIYANVDGFSPATGSHRPAKERSLLDRWMLSELALTTREVCAHLDTYKLYEAAQRLVDLVDALSNWYVRRSRARFWAPVNAGATAGQDKNDAYFTLYESLVTLSRLIAPFTPFLAEELHQNLARRPFPDTAPESVHLAAYPEPDLGAVDEPLAREMRAIRELVSLGLQVRTLNKLKVRQPLDRADLIVSDRALADALRAHEALVREELNVHEVRWLAPGEERGEVRYVLKPNFRALGPKLGKKVQIAKQVLARADAAALRASLATHGKVTIDLEGEPVELGPEEIEVVVEASEGFAAAGGRAGVVVLHTALTDALRDEGLGREILSRVQGLRKELDLGFTERVRLAVDGSERVRRVAAALRDEIAAEALAVEVILGAPSFAGERREATVDGEDVILVLSRA